MKVVFLLAFLLAAPAQTKETLYYQAMQQLQKKQYQQAAKTLKSLHKVLVGEQRKETKGSKKWHLLTIGQSDALEWLAGVSWKLGHKQRACLYHQTIETKRKTLPTDWNKWNLNAVVRKRLLASKGFLTGQCASVPSFVSIDVSPKDAIVSLKQGKSWKVVKATRFGVTQEKISLKIEAPKHRTVLLEGVAIPRWRSKRLRASLKKILIVVVPPRPRLRRPVKRRSIVPPPTPVYKKWWFWTVIGVGVAGGVAAVVAGTIVTADVEHSFKGRQGETFYKVW